MPTERHALAALLALTESGIDHTVTRHGPVRSLAEAAEARGLQQWLRERGYDLLLYNITGDPTARSRLFATHLLSKRVDAVMVLALQPTPAEVASLDRIGTPTVVVGGAVPGWSDVPNSSGRSSAQVETPLR